MKRLSSPILALAVAALVAAACGPSIGGLGSVSPNVPSAEPSVPQSSGDVTPGSGSPSVSPSAAPTSGPGGSPSSPPSGAPSPSAAPSSAPPQQETMVVRAYFHLGGDESTEGLAPVLREVPRTQAPARAAMEQLLGGLAGRELMDGAGLSTAVPAGTRLLDLSIGAGTATVDLSREFEGSAGAEGTFVNLAQVVYTLTQFPTVERVQFRIEGEDVTVFGSDGLVIDGPQTRADYEEQLPAILVDRPAWGASLLNPGRISGTANVFEATLQVVIRDGDGTAIAEETVTATCGTGCRGTFDVTIPYDVDEAQWGELETFIFSARDGSVEASRAYPVWLTPAG